MKLIPVLMILAGALFIYSAHIDDDPRNVVFKALGSTTRVPHKSAGEGKVVGTWVDPTASTLTPDPTFRSV